MDAFDRLSVQWPQWRKQPIVELVETMARDPLFELDIAIKNQNMAQFMVGYAHLTEACNTCHQAEMGSPFQSAGAVAFRTLEHRRRAPRGWCGAKRN